MSQLFASGGQSIGVSASASVLPMNIWDSFPLGWTGWISLLSKGLSRAFSQHHSSKASILQRSAFFTVQLSHPYMTTGKNIALTKRTFVGKVMSLLLNMLSRLVIAFLPRSKCLLISWLQSPSAVILEPRKINSVTVSTVSPSTSLISRGLSLPFGTLGSSRRLKKPFPTNTERIYTQEDSIGSCSLSLVLHTVIMC